MANAMDHSHITQASTVPEVLNTPFAALLRHLKEQHSAPCQAPAGSRVRHRARIQALHWLEQLDTTESLDEVWPAFEAWLREHPENRHQYLMAERVQLVIEDLRRGCPKEGSAAANRLLRPPVVAGSQQPSHAARAKWLLLTTGVVASTALLFWVTRQIG
jgi:ferric-dicitrate binding protein FerR (iron transport regulator)